MATPTPFPVEEVEVESSLEPLKRKKKKTKSKESELAHSKMALSDPPPFASEDVLTSQTQVAPEFEKSQAPPEAPSTMIPEEGSFDVAAREALRAAEEILYEGSSSTPNPSMALIEDPLLSVEDFLIEEQGDLTPLESDAIPKLTPPASALLGFF